MTREKVLAVLAVGFTVVIASLLAVAYIGWQNTELMQESAANLSREQFETLQLVDRIRRSQVTLRLIVFRIYQDPDAAESGDILALLDQADSEIRQVLTQSAPQHQAWQELQAAVNAFTVEARRILGLVEPTSSDSASLFRHQESVMFAVRRLVSTTQANTRVIQQRIERRANQVQRQSAYLLAGCFAVALLATFFSVRVANNLFKQMEEQTGELNRVSWQLLEKQELAAQRFSHELHDELGQTLAAVKANLQAMRPGSRDDVERVKDCVALAEGAIENVREMSQLLHPRVLDDFGLVGGLRWLCERFSQRTGIAVNYEADFQGRLSDESRTHMFRIAQEALTNAVRHSGATSIDVQLRASGDGVTLLIRDDGSGIRESGNGRPRGMGLLGMRARARMAGGQLTIESGKGKGTRILVAVPLAKDQDDSQENPYSAG
ncbi:MAG: sensor histidine kinase [Bryobacterales bacterium]